MADPQRCASLLKNWNNDLEDGECTIQVLFFAAAKDAVGQSQMELCVPTGSTAESVSNEIDDLAQIKSHCAFAIDHSLVSPDTPVYDGCTLAILPPVSGG